MNWIETKPQLCQIKTSDISDFKGGIDLEHVSLFPVDTWKGRKTGLRKDLAQALYDLELAFFASPGLHSGRYRPQYPLSVEKFNRTGWKQKTEWKSPAIYLYQSFLPGLLSVLRIRLFEFFSCRRHRSRAASGTELRTCLPVPEQGRTCPCPGWRWTWTHTFRTHLIWLNLANGDVTTKYGKIRSEMGHPEPFHMKLIAIGNEQWGSLYPERLEPFMKAIKAKYPEIKIIGSAVQALMVRTLSMGGRKWEGSKQTLWTSTITTVIRYRFYPVRPLWISMTAKSQKFCRWICPVIPKTEKQLRIGSVQKLLLWQGLERNADRSSCVPTHHYLPTYRDGNGVRIWFGFDNMNSVRSVNYYVQQLYGHNSGTKCAEHLENKLPLPARMAFTHPRCMIKQNEIILKIANTSDAIKTINYKPKGLKFRKSG